MKKTSTARREPRPPIGNKRLLIKPTRSYGRGIFAAEDIPKGTVIHVLSGERRTLDEFVKRISRGDIRSIPRPQLEKYQAAGALQRYLKPLLKEIESGAYQIPAYELRALEKLENPGGRSSR